MSTNTNVNHDPHDYDYLHCPDCRGAPMLQPVKGESKCRCIRCGHEVEANT